MSSKIITSTTLLDLLGFTIKRYTSTSGIITGYDEITDSTFIMPPEEILNLVTPHIRAAMRLLPDDEIHVIGTLNETQLHFSQQEVRGIPTSEMKGKSFKELKKKGFWTQEEFIGANRLASAARGNETATTTIITQKPNGDIYSVESLVLEVQGGLKLSFSVSRKVTKR